MATLSVDGPGNRTIQVAGADGKRRSVRLGKVPKKSAESIRNRVAALETAGRLGVPADFETQQWVAGLGDDLHDKLSRAGLVPARRSAALGAFLDAFIERAAADRKGGTVTNLVTAANDLRRFFGETADVRTVTPAMAADFRHHYLTRTPKLAATHARRLKTARQFFAAAVMQKLTTANPFDGVTTASVLPDDRRYYLSAGDAGRLIAAADPTWAAIIALARFGGLRCPSEVLSLKWEHVNFESNRMTVPSPKTEHLAGKAYRVCPVFAALAPHLADAFDRAAPGEVYVVGGPRGDRYRAAADTPKGWVSCNVRTPFEKLIRRAGLTPWPRLFHNLRASCETDLAADFPAHVAAAWLGHSPDVARKHYLQVRESDYEAATRPRVTADSGGAESGAAVVQKAVRTGVDTTGPGGTRRAETPQPRGSWPVPSSLVPSGPDEMMTLRGFEPRSTP